MRDYFLNKTWAPQLCVVLATLFIILPCLSSCADNNIVQPKNENAPQVIEVSLFEQPAKLAELELDARVIREKIDRAHNGPLARYYGKKLDKFGDEGGKIGEKVSLEDFREMFVESYNEEFQAMGLQIQINNADFDLVLSKMIAFINDTGIDLTKPETINPNEAFDKLASKGYMSEEEAFQCKNVIKRIGEGVNPYEDERGLLTATLPSETVKLAADIGVASYNLWTAELHELYPELEWSWPDIDWQKVKEKIGLYTCDVVGCISGGLGFLGAGPVASIIAAAIIGGLSSLAFEIALIILV